MKVLFSSVMTVRDSTLTLFTSATQQLKLEILVMIVCIQGFLPYGATSSDSSISGLFISSAIDGSVQS